MMKNAFATPDQRVGSLPSATGFVPALEGFRAAAFFAVLTTHVAFQTASHTGSTINRIWGRFDLSVALFFALSGFLLWRAHALNARRDNPGPARPVGEYVRSRLVRIMPAYLVAVAAVFLLLPRNAGASIWTWTANLTLTQVFVPDSLVEGLTQAWTLSVELAFYLTLPLLWMALARLRGPAARWRIPVIGSVGVLSLAWALVPWYDLGLPEAVNDQILPPAFASWFAAGMVLAELSAQPPGRLAALARHRHSRWGWWAVAVAAFAVSTHPEWFTEGFVHPSGAEFATRTGIGAVTAFCLLAPAVLAPQGMRFHLLGSTVVTTLGRWSYSLYLWHMLVLHFAFQLAFIPMFAGQMLQVWLLTAVISTVLAAASYSLVEVPAQRWLAPRRAPRGRPADGQVAASPAQTSPATVST